MTTTARDSAAPLARLKLIVIDGNLLEKSLFLAATDTATCRATVL